MKKALKLYFHVVFSLLLFSAFNLARAEPIPAVSKTTITGWSQNGSYSAPCTTSARAVITSLVGKSFSNVDELRANVEGTTCEHGMFLYSVQLTGSGGRVFWKQTETSPYSMDFQLSGTSAPACPSTGGWTLSGSMCTPPDCPSGSTRRPDGTCTVQCPSGQFDCNGSCVPNCSVTQTRDDTKPGCCGCSTFNNAAYPKTLVVDLLEGAESPDKPCFHGCEFSGGGAIRLGNTYVTDLGNPLGNRCTANYENPEKKTIESKGEMKEPTPQQPRCTENVVTSSDGRVVCVPAVVPQSRKPEVTTNKKTETNEQGQQKQTEIVTTRDPVTGALTVQTVVTGPGGQSTSSESKITEPGQGSSDSTGGAGNGQGDCTGEDCPEGGNDPLGPKGSFGDASGDIEAAKDRLTAEWSLIKQQASGMFSGASTGSGALPCPPPVTFLGANFSLCLSDYSDQLAVIGLAFIAACYVVAAMVLLRS